MRIALLYAVIGLVWIYGSDAAMSRVAPNVHDVLLVSIAKGAFYVLVTAALLFVLVRRNTARERSAFAARVRSEARFRTQYEAMPVPTFTWRIDGEGLTLLDRNTAALALLPVQPTTTPIGVLDLLGAAPKTLDALLDCAGNHGTAVATECLALPGEAGPRWRQSHLAFVAPDLVLHHLLDIHEQETVREERARVEEALRQSEARFRLMIEGSEQVFYYVHDRAGVFQYLSPSVRAVLGYAPDELVGKSCYSTVPPGEDEEVRQRTEGALNTGRPEPPYTILNLDRSGRLVTLELTESPLYENGVIVGMQGFARDVTQRRRLEDDLRQAQKMEAIGRLAGGVAHDFNNILTVINGSTHVALELAAENPQLVRLLGEVHSAADRAAGLTRQLLAFSRKQMVQPRALDLNAVLAGTERMLRRLIGEDVTLSVARHPALRTTWADPGQMEQVLLNLVINARDAMPSGGALRIATRLATVDEPPEHARPGEFVVLEVADTGVGMPADIATRIFEPFFTTKPLGTGTGLGLSTVYGIVRQAGGWIEVETAPAKGSVFRVFFPVYEGSAETAASTPTGGTPHRGNERILVVEDEPAVRRLVRVVLQRYGYEILEASDGREALRMIMEQAEPVDLILSDVVMPGMSGPELLHECRTLCPTTRFVLMSGYAGDRLPAEESPVHVPVLEKPFEPVELARVIRALLDGAADPLSPTA